MKKSKQPVKSSFRVIKETYKQSADDSLKEYIQRFLTDPEREIKIDNRTYHKVIMLCELGIRSRGTFILVTLSSRIRICIGDVLIDENGRMYTMKGVEMMRYASDMYPECLEIVTLSVSGDPEAMGDYLAVCDPEKKEE